MLIKSLTGSLIQCLFVSWLFNTFWVSWHNVIGEMSWLNRLLISAREKIAVCDVTNLPYMDINWQSISIYGYLVTSLTYTAVCLKPGALEESCVYVVWVWLSSLSSEYPSVAEYSCPNFCTKFCGLLSELDWCPNYLNNLFTSYNKHIIRS